MVRKRAGKGGLGVKISGDEAEKEDMQRGMVKNANYCRMKLTWVRICM